MKGVNARGSLKLFQNVLKLESNEVAKGLPSFIEATAHGSPSVRKTHCSCGKHKKNVKGCYQKWMSAYIFPFPSSAPQACISQTLRVPTCNQRSNEQWLSKG
ncbi:unnamed protein product [Pipistrellus nathusii]|uniref:U1-C C2H2-type zinc finger domain-containing protein n=1 Tax=Pipistrellus nathusii TaxID=59473 RepID=A0ABN9ZF97_PIPNA